MIKSLDKIIEFIKKMRYAGLLSEISTILKLILANRRKDFGDQKFV